MAKKLSHSSLEKFQNCERLWYINYVEGRWPDTDPEPFVFGRKFHDLIAKSLKEKLQLNDFDGTDAHIEGLAYHTISVMADKLNIDLNGGVIGIEKNMQTDDFMGFIDLIVKDRYNKVYIIDWKTTTFKYSEHDIITSDQLHSYAYLYRAIYGDYPDYICYVTINKNNGLIDFYIKDVEIEDIESWVSKKKAIKNKIALYNNDKNNFVKNPGYCKAWGRTCPFYDECWIGQDIKLISESDDIIKVYVNG